MLICSHFNRPDMNRCDVSEDSTTQAVNGMSSIQPDQCQVDANKEQLQHSGAPLSELLFDIKQAEPIEIRIHKTFKTMLCQYQFTIKWG